MYCVGVIGLARRSLDRPFRFIEVGTDDDVVGSYGRYDLLVDQGVDEGQIKAMLGPEPKAEGEHDDQAADDGGPSSVQGAARFYSGADIDTGAAEVESFVDTGKLYPSSSGPAQDFFDDAMWMDADTESPKAIEAFDTAIEDDAGTYGVSEADLWARPDLVGDVWGS